MVRVEYLHNGRVRLGDLDPSYEANHVHEVGIYVGVNRLNRDGLDQNHSNRYELDEIQVSQIIAINDQSIELYGEAETLFGELCRAPKVEMQNESSIQAINRRTYEYFSSMGGNPNGKPFIDYSEKPSGRLSSLGFTHGDIFCRVESDGLSRGYIRSSRKALKRFQDQKKIVSDQCKRFEKFTNSDAGDTITTQTLRVKAEAKFINKKEVNGDNDILCVIEPKEGEPTCCQIVFKTDDAKQVFNNWVLSQGNSDLPSNNSAGSVGLACAITQEVPPEAGLIIILKWLTKGAQFRGITKRTSDMIEGNVATAIEWMIARVLYTSSNPQKNVNELIQLFKKKYQLNISSITLTNLSSGFDHHDKVHKCDVDAKEVRYTIVFNDTFSRDRFEVVKSEITMQDSLILLSETFNEEKALRLRRDYVKFAGHSYQVNGIFGPKEKPKRYEVVEKALKDRLEEKKAVKNWFFKSPVEASATDCTLKKHRLLPQKYEGIK